MFQHFGQRLKRDLKQIVDRRLENSSAASGSHFKVCLTLSKYCHSLISCCSHPALRWMSSPTRGSGGLSFSPGRVTLLTCSEDSLSGLVDPCWHPWYVFLLTLPAPYYLILSPSPSSTRHATPRRNTMRSVPAFADATRSSAVQHRLVA